jgi:hypothetical protein
MTTDRMLVEDVLSSSNRAVMIDKMVKYLENVRYTTAEWIFHYVADYVDSGLDFDYLSVRDMLEKMAEDLKFNEVSK